VRESCIEKHSNNEQKNDSYEQERSSLKVITDGWIYKQVRHRFPFLGLNVIKVLGELIK
jgi:hypothetical protein